MPEVAEMVRTGVSSDGFVVVPDAIDGGLAERARAALDRCVREDLDAEDETRRVDRNMVMNLMFRDEVFLELLDQPVLLEALDAVLGDTSLVYAYQSSSMPPSGDNYSARVHVDCPRVVPGYVTNAGIIIALDDFTEENGATYFLPGSFEREDPPSDEEFFAGAERAFPKRGDLVIFNARTWHYGGANQTADYRHAATINACRSFMRQRFDYPRMVSPDLEARLTENQRRLLGFNVRMPVSLDEYYVPEEQRLYKSGQG